MASSPDEWASSFLGRKGSTIDDLWHELTISATKRTNKVGRQQVQENHLLEVVRSLLGTCSGVVLLEYCSYDWDGHEPNDSPKLAPERRELLCGRPGKHNRSYRRRILSVQERKVARPAEQALNRGGND